MTDLTDDDALLRALGQAIRGRASVTFAAFRSGATEGDMRAFVAVANLDLLATLMADPDEPIARFVAARINRHTTLFPQSLATRAQQLLAEG